jgi:tripartite-type tricarboxylate transporter receptor subunit TctC
MSAARPGIRRVVILGQRSPAALWSSATLKESGVDIAINGWCGFYGPAGMDAAIVEK